MPNRAPMPDDSTGPDMRICDATRQEGAQWHRCVMPVDHVARGQQHVGQGLAWDVAPATDSPAEREREQGAERRQLRMQRIMETYSDDARRRALIECELEGDLRAAAIHLDDYSNGILAGTNEYLKTERTPAIRLLIAALIEARAASVPVEDS